MALNKNKVIAAAQRFTQKGQYDRAIKEYRSIVEEEPDDVRIWLKIGDLYTKKGATSQAISTYVRVANQYADKGFHLKAVAVYKKVLNIDPSFIDAHKSLGDLYVTLGLGPDAVAQYQIVVGSYERDARYTDSLELLKIIVQLGPDDHANRIRLAEAHARIGQLPEAIEQFKHVLEQLDALGHLDEYVQVAERLLYVAPEELDVVRDLSKVYLRRGDAKRALARLQVLFRADPNNVGTLELLAQAFHEIGQTAKAVSVYRELARIHGEAGDTNAQVAAYRKLLGVQPDDEEALRATGGLDIQGRAPVAAAGPAASSEEALTREEQIGQFLADIDIYRKYGLKDHAQERIAKVLELDPSNLAALERRRDLSLENEDRATAIGALLQAAEIASRRDPHRAMGYLGEVLQHDPGNADATARMKALSSGMAEQLASSDAQPAIAPPVDDAFDVDLDLGELDFEDDLGADEGFALDMDSLPPAPDDDPFGDLLDDAPPAPARPSTEDDFGGLLDEATPAPAEGDFGDLLAQTRRPTGHAPAVLVPDAPPTDDDFADLLGDAGQRTPPAPVGGDDFGDLLADEGGRTPAAPVGDDDFGDLLVDEGERTPTAPVGGDEFGDLLVDEGERTPTAPVGGDEFGDLLADEPPAVVSGDFGDAFGDLLADDDERADDDAFGDLLADDGAVASRDEFGDLLADAGGAAAPRDDFGDLLADEGEPAGGDDFGSLLSGAGDDGALAGASAAEADADDFGGLLVEKPAAAGDDFGDLMADEGEPDVAAEADAFADLLADEGEPDVAAEADAFAELLADDDAFGDLGGGAGAAEDVAAEADAFADLLAGAEADGFGDLLADEGERPGDDVSAEADAFADLLAGDLDLGAEADAAADQPAEAPEDDVGAEADAFADLLAGDFDVGAEADALAGQLAGDDAGAEADAFADQLAGDDVGAEADAFADLLAGEIGDGGADALGDVGAEADAFAEGLAAGGAAPEADDEAFAAAFGDAAEAPDAEDFDALLHGIGGGEPGALEVPVELDDGEVLGDEPPDLDDSMYDDDGTMVAADPEAMMRAAMAAAPGRASADEGLELDLDEAPADALQRALDDAAQFAEDDEEAPEASDEDPFAAAMDAAGEEAAPLDDDPFGDLLDDAQPEIGEAVDLDVEIDAIEGAEGVSLTPPPLVGSDADAPAWPPTGAAPLMPETPVEAEADAFDGDAFPEAAGAQSPGDSYDFEGEVEVASLPGVALDLDAPEDEAPADGVPPEPPMAEAQLGGESMDEIVELDDDDLIELDDDDLMLEDDDDFGGVSAQAHEPPPPPGDDDDIKFEIDFGLDDEQDDGIPPLADPSASMEADLAEDLAPLEVPASPPPAQVRPGALPPLPRRPTPGSLLGSPQPAPERGFGDLQPGPAADDAADRTMIAEAAEAELDATIDVDAAGLAVGAAEDLSDELAELDFMLESGLRDDARELISELLEEHPGHPDLVQRRTRLDELEAIDADAALGSLEAEAEADDIQSVHGAQLSDLSEDDANTHFDLGMAFKEMGQYKKAVESLEKASRNRDKRVEAMRLIGLCYTEQGRYADAARQLREVIATPDLDAPVAISLRYDLANVLEQSGNKAGARKELQAIVDAGGADFLDVQSRLTALGG